MGTIGAGIRLATMNPCRIVGAAHAGTITRSQWNQGGSQRNFWFGEGTVIAGASIAETASIPNGHEPPACWAMAPKGGGLSAYNSIESAGNLSGALALGVNLEASMVSDGSITTANLSLVVQLATVMIANCGLDGSLGAPANMSATMTSEGQIAAALSAIANMDSTMTGSGGLDGSNLRGTAEMSATLSSTGDVVTAESCAAAVWNALAASFNNPGTTGELLNSAGAAADPLLGVVEGALTLRDVQRLVLAVLTGDATAMDGIAQFRSLDGSKVRVGVSATVAGGARTVTTKDPT